MWTTKKGEKVRIKDMTDSHLLNTIKLIERNHRDELNAAYSVASILTGEMATFCAERDIDCMEDEGPSYTHPLYSDLVDEAERRKLI